MEEQKQIIEQVFKNAFDEFTPDVSPKVWSGISQQLAHPVAPGVQPSGSVAKMAAAKFGSVSTWIVGGITAVAVTAGVLVYQQNQKSNDFSSFTEVATSAVQNNSEEKMVESTPLFEQPTSENQTISSLAVKKSSDNNKEHLQNLTSKVSEESSGINNTLLSEAATSAPASINKDQDAAPANETLNNPGSSQAVAEPVSDNIQPANDINISPLILANTTVGFAPLQVACLLNKENMKGDWNFGDGFGQLQSNSVSHKYIKPGTYTLQCVAGSTKLVKTIEVIGQISTAFSPNGDGINDYFYVEAGNLKDFSLDIFDRNGRKIAALKNAGEKWDGITTKGEAALPGTYFYELTATTENGHEIHQRGALTMFK